MKKILVIDDEMDVLNSVKNVLERAGFSVQITNNGQEGLNSLSAEPFPDLILLDVEMPEMNGYTFMVELSKNQKLRAIPVVVITGHADMRPIFHLKHVKDYLVKPVVLQDLVSKVKAILDPTPEEKKA